MNASELRIGNFVLYNTYHDYIGAKNIKDKVINIESISNNGVNLEISNYSHCPENYWIPLENITPIPLTEEWLLKFGFEKHPTNQFWYKKDCFCISALGVIEIVSEWDRNSVKLNYEIEFIHQLQNVFFAITNKELLIK